ncbi:MAG: T9SS type A sorting domain-containing protein, partial [Bacteroidota bacterium]
GDSDRDGICDNQDNCDFTVNPDQADNDGDGIGNVCDVTPNGGGGTGPTCKEAIVSAEAGKINIGNLAQGAKVEIAGPSTGYTPQVVCEGNCSSTEMVSGLTPGHYNVTVQTFNPYCYEQYFVEVPQGGDGGNSCDGQGGDSDGDGICDNQDNCDFTFNPDQADNDGDGIGNVCDDTPNGGGGPDCKAANVSGGNGKVTISNLAQGAKVEISGPSTGYGQQLVCEGNCNGTEMVSGLSAGAYNVTIQTFNPYCYNLVTVNVTGGGSGNPCDGQGGDSDGDGICDDQDNCDFTRNPDQADNDGDGIGNVCDDTPNGGGGGSPDCKAVNVSGGDGKVTISNLAQGAKVEISGPSTGYGQQLVCEGNCNSSEMVTGLSAGEYHVTVQTFNPYCYNRVKVVVTGGNTDPCANQGGDSDGDGICDNQDNCRTTFNPDQADNDGDGIGNVCDDTPNGDPCANKGGDSDGDGVCDNDDNCRTTFNPDQADNDGDGLGNVCDDTPNGGPTTCTMRTAKNTRLCFNNSQIGRGGRYGGFLLLDKNGNSNFIGDFYTIHNGKLTEFSDGTAKFTGRYVNIKRNSASFDIDIMLSNRKRDDDSIHPKPHDCGIHQDDDIYYYLQTSGHLRGRGDLAGLVLRVTRFGEPFQIGTGANITDDEDDFGGSGWLKVDIERQANNGRYHINTGSNGQEGDINIELTGRSSDAFCSAGSRASLTFNAFESARQVSLQWATNTTFKNDYYIIEKSTDGTIFEELAKVESEFANDDMETYRELDKQPALGQNYYRVKQVYFDGSFDYTNVELVNFNIDLDALDVYPNPVKNELFINLSQFEGKQAYILLTNQYGQVIQELEVDKIDAAPVRMEIGNVINGMYFLTIRPNGGAKFVTKKLVVDQLD